MAKANNPNIELQEINNIETLQNNHAAELAVVASENFDLSAIFFSVGTAFFETLGKYIFLPVAAALAAARAILSWRQAYLTRWKSRFVTGAVIESLAALAITVAVVGAFALTAVFAFVTPVIFTAVLGSKSLYNFGAAIYYGAKAIFASPTKARRNEYISRAARHAGVGLATGLGCVGAALSLLVGKIALAPIAAVGGIIGGLIAIGGIIKIIKDKRDAKKPTTVVTPPPQQEPDPAPAPSSKPKRGINHILNLDLSAKKPVDEKTPLLATASPKNTRTIMDQISSVQNATSTQVKADEPLAKTSSMTEVKEPDAVRTIDDNTAEKMKDLDPKEPESQYEAETREGLVRTINIPANSELFSFDEDYIPINKP